MSVPSPTCFLPPLESQNILTRFQKCILRFFQFLGHLASQTECFGTPIHSSLKIYKNGTVPGKKKWGRRIGFLHMKGKLPLFIFSSFKMLYEYYFVRRKFPALIYNYVADCKPPIYRGSDKSLARPDWQNNWKVAIFRPTRRSLLQRRPGWTDKLLNFFWVACKS